MKQIIRLTESDLNKIVEEAVRRSIKEGTVNEYGMKDFGKDMLGLGLGAGAFGGAVAGNAYLHGDDPEIDPQQAEINQTVKDELGQDALSPRGSMPSDTISWEKANRFESVISKAITESVNKILSEAINELDPRTYASYAQKRQAQSDKATNYSDQAKYSDKAFQGQLAARDAFNKQYGEDVDGYNGFGDRQYNKMGMYGNDYTVTRQSGQFDNPQSYMNPNPQNTYTTHTYDPYNDTTRHQFATRDANNGNYIGNKIDKTYNGAKGIGDKTKIARQMAQGNGQYIKGQGWQ